VVGCLIDRACVARSLEHCCIKDSELALLLCSCREVGCDAAVDPVRWIFESLHLACDGSERTVVRMQIGWRNGIEEAFLSSTRAPISFGLVSVSCCKHVGARVRVRGGRGRSYSILTKHDGIQRACGIDQLQAKHVSVLWLGDRSLAMLAFILIVACYRYSITQPHIHKSINE